MSIRHGLLALLRDGPQYGYQLKTEFESGTGGIWPLNVGQVYTTLDRLERDGLVAAGPENNNNKSYSLTATGKRDLDQWLHSPDVEATPPRDELMVKVLLSIHTDPRSALGVIDANRNALTGLLQRHRRRLRAVESVTEQLVADALIARTESELRWLELCEQRLSDSKNHTSNSNNNSTTNRKPGR
jgi:DNA-binding PadR family transcriptional regulator